MPLLKLPLPTRRQIEKPPSAPLVLQSKELRMGFFEHLNELRGRLMKSFLAVVLGTIVGLIVASEVLHYLIRPYADRLSVLGPTGGVVAYFRVSLLVGGIIAIPMITYQVLMFVIPGLTKKEKRTLFLSLPAITGLFLIGIAFSWFVLIPPAISFLNGFEPELFKSEWTADNYLSFVTSLLFWMGVAFETPLVFFILSLMGLVGARVLIKNWRVAIVGAAVASALITPTVDPVNMSLVMGPLLVLYLLSIILVMVGSRIFTNATRN
ncbi:MAG: twin-arginine translocase subunit TatC [Chitinophagaceae bacterium]|nr:twin-arginine translocase subunit TatC [Anaerolineae bacterium]